ncbi:hypothetical protein [Comamonas sp. MYb69]|uniref:hypothetical protein n=1 Tax=Comamonas sp. MYb69 TaxID=1848650 RepID=UPI0030A24DD6
MVSNLYKRGKLPSPELTAVVRFFSTWCALAPSLAALALLWPLPARAGNYATCILDHAARVRSDAAAKAVSQGCLASYPGGIEAVRQGASIASDDFSSGAQCSARKAEDTRSSMAAYQIKRACQRLYDHPEVPAPAPIAVP